MTACIAFTFHKGHNVQITQMHGKPALICLDCGVIADIEAIGAHVTPENAIKMASGEKAIPLNQPSKGVSI